jgi:hypothetical protein
VRVPKALGLRGPSKMSTKCFFKVAGHWRERGGAPYVMEFLQTIVACGQE